MKKAVIVIPTYNEAGNIEKLIDKIINERKQISNWNIDVLFVDSTSTDKTQDIIKKLKQKHSWIHLFQTKKEGLGRAYTQGFSYTLEHLKPFLIFEMDADLSHDPVEIKHFLYKVEKGADFVIGSRYMKGGSIPADWGLHRKILSGLGNLVIRLGFMKLSITDWTGGYRAVKAWIIKDALGHIGKYSGYVFQIALLDFVLKQNGRIEEVPIKFAERTHGISKINALEYILSIFLYMFIHSSFIKFVIVGLIGFCIDFGVSAGLHTILSFPVLAANLISIETAILSNFLMNNFWSFAHKKIDRSFGRYIVSFMKFNLVSSGNLLIQLVGIAILSRILGEQWWLIYKLCLIVFVVIPYSYFFYNKFIWKDK